MNENLWDVIVIGGGPAGLASAISSKDSNAKTCVIEREERLGGVLKQCIHDGFGLIRFNEKLTGPEYAYRYIEMIRDKNIPVFYNTFVHEIKRDNDIFTLTLINSEKSVFYFQAKSIILSTGCRERTSKQIFIHGDRPAGIFNAGLAQYYINIQGFMPAKRCVILGSGDIGLIMARRLTLEGAKVEGVYEVKSEPSGLARNIAQCLEDFDIPLHLSTTITKVHGKRRVEGVTTSRVDENFSPIAGSQNYVECDSLILSVGLIPENEISESLNVPIDIATKGPYVDQNMMTKVDGVFSCGNALHVNDLVDYVSESGQIAGERAAVFSKGIGKKRRNIPVKTTGDFLYIVPQIIDLSSAVNNIIFYFRSKRTLKKARLRIASGREEIFTKRYIAVKPPEMERLILNLSKLPNDIEELKFELWEEEISTPVDS